MAAEISDLDLHRMFGQAGKKNILAQARFWKLQKRLADTDVTLMKC